MMRKILFFTLSLFIASPAYALDKNTASQKWAIFCFDRTDNSAKLDDETHITADLSLNGAASVDLDFTNDGTADNPTELGSGYYVFSISAAQSNADQITIIPVSSTTDIQCVGCPGAVWTTAAGSNSVTIANNSAQANITYVAGDAVQDNEDGRLEVNVEEWKDGTAPAMTGDAFARIGVPAGASIAADLAAIESQTDDIGAAGAGLTAVPWNAAWEAEIESEVDDALGGGTGTALTAIPWNASWAAEVQSECTDSLNAYDPPSKTEMDTAFTEIKGATFSTDTDQLEDLRDRGDAAWITATGFSTHNAADVKTAIEADGSKIDHLWEMTEDDGGVRRLTTNALEQASGGVADWTTGEKEQIRDALGVDGTKTTATSGDLQTISDVVASATYGNAALKTLLDDKPDIDDLVDELELTDTVWSAEDRTMTSGSIVWSTIVESGSLGDLTAEEAVRLLLSFVAGESTGAGTGSVTFYRAVDEDNTAGIVMTVDANGNRSAVAIDVTDIIPF